MKLNSLTIGLDLGDRKHHVCVLNASGKIAAEEVITNTRECITRFAERYPRATYVMETGTHSPWVSRLLEARGLRVIVGNARKLRAISQSQTKSDARVAPAVAAAGLQRRSNATR
jgi:transposase